MAIRYQIFFRACDKIESVHKVKRPFGLNKIETIKLSFYSLYSSLKGFQFQITIIGDDLSTELIEFFMQFDNLIINNSKLGSASKSLKKQIDLALNVPREDWIYLCEDDYLHSSNTFKFITEFIEKKEQYLKTSAKKKNFLNKIIGDLSTAPLIIHPPDYPDRYLPEWKRHSFIFLSKYCHWRQISNTTHTFMLQSSTFQKFEKYIKLSAIGPSDSILSEKVYGRIFIKNKALCISPILGLSTHLTEGCISPLVDWQKICTDYIKKMKVDKVWK